MTIPLKIELCDKPQFQDMTPVQKDVLRGIQKIVAGVNITEFEINLKFSDGMEYFHGCRRLPNGLSNVDIEKPSVGGAMEADSIPSAHPKEDDVISINDGKDG